MWIRRLAISSIWAALIAATVWLALIETFLASFNPSLLLQLTLPVAMAIFWIAGWQIIETLKRWIPDQAKKSNVS